MARNRTKIKINETRNLKVSRVRVRLMFHYVIIMICRFHESWQRLNRIINNSLFYALNASSITRSTGKC